MTINDWVEKQTNDRIKDLIPQGKLDPLTRLVLTNAVYFKGVWRTKFVPEYTKGEDFKLGSGNTIKVQMMHGGGEKGDFNYAETDKLQILELSYEGDDISMLVFLPKGNDLKAVEEFINHERFSEWRNILKDEQVLVYLPRFKFETKYFMKSDFMAMGITTAFSTNADFSGMTGNKKLNISEVIHQTFVDVNEEGTEAAGATAAMATEAALGGEIKTFLVDHPFIFVIQDRATGNILFMGRVTDPTK